MASFFRRPMSKTKLVMIPLSGIMAGSLARAAIDSDTVQNNEQYKNMSRVCTGTLRAGKLLSTVSVICMDYGYIIFKKRNEECEFDKLSNEIVRIRDEHEKISHLRWKNVNTPLEAKYKAQAEALYEKMGELSEKCSQVESSFGESHRRSALRLHELCEANGGVYVKLGQHISQLDYLFPKEFISVLRKLLNDTPQSSYESVRAVIKEELGYYPEELWTEFEETPIASASLAQVHVARDAQGKKYAVKVQHEALQVMAESDIAAVSFAVNVVSRVFKDFNYNWLARELEINLPQELNFEHEAANLNQCRVLLKDMIASGDLALPEVAKTSKRVLVMSFEEGSYITDHEAMAELGVPLDNVASVISRTFCEQIFRHGFVHCDPHLANILVRTQPNNKKKAQIVLLDHGLYRQLDDEFRMNYCHLWKALVTFNRSDIEKYCRKLNAGDMYPLLSAMLTLSAWDDVTSGDINRLRGKSSNAEKEKMKTYAQRYIRQINQLMENVPSSLLLLLKTNDCLRCLDKEIGAPINTLAVTADVSSQVILQDDLKQATTWTKYFQAYSEFCKVQLTVAGIALAYYFTSRR
mmetsp:Transcript_22379/g.37917  ORF Transcript_22379/g.37917 Transcript_22379/m.37917 type:complete len:581 (-) Transcript_22379:181-1923(-)